MQDLHVFAGVDFALHSPPEDLVRIGSPFMRASGDHAEAFPTGVGDLAVRAANGLVYFPLVWHQLSATLLISADFLGGATRMICHFLKWTWSPRCKLVSAAGW